MEIGDLLARNFLFRNLDPDVIQRIADLGTTQQLADDQVLFLKGDEGDALYGVLAGRIRISSGDADGKEIILNIIDPGDIFGEIALLDGKPRTADASAMQPSQLFRIQRSDFVALMGAEPRLTTHLLEMVCDRIRKTSEMLEDSAFLDLPARLAKRLLSLAKYYGEADQETTLTGIQISQAELGQLMGTSRESINKHLQYWRGRGWITLGRGRVTIDAPDALQNLVERDED
ncbi:MAG: Crp/Fnr family transcriptional regulator [Rhodospirillales bacterium]|jgi:CRP-like cAMP-binding protein|nr:transcriptional regulator [Rhodospirillaceae bacterium]MDP6428394.1 Crp/Fnr family transcriptional regulator [Rhodospirillales bacterium]MDP6642874.1 Crp/Fnr family transcriptional regulator [Rhodospirillales bacterium]MDP6841592.1 Crp/Fnr family transcriptional regulator [Rhodospirillales bacterium]|tara:strand:+ start:168 stop:860 length:693 start_codon:yes stop_codon:yes gene_type:complete